MWRWILLPLGLYLLVALALYLFQRRLLYFPEKASLTPSLYGVTDMESVVLTAFDGTRLTAWWHAPVGDAPLVIYFHGNAGHLGYRAPKLQAFIDAGMGVLAVSYRGYGESEGSPSETGIYQDARAAVVYARETRHIPNERIIFYGESLGTGVAVQMASETAPALMVLEAAYLSVRERAQELYPYFPARFILKDQFDSRSKLENLRCPLLLFHGLKDTVILPHHGQTIHATYMGPKKAFFYEHIDHVSFDGPLLAKEILEYYRVIRSAPSGPDISVSAPPPAAD